MGVMLPKSYPNLKKNKLGGTVAPLTKEPVFVWPGLMHSEVGWRGNASITKTAMHGRFIDIYKDGGPCQAYLEKLLAFSVTLWHVAFQGKWTPESMEYERLDKLFGTEAQAKHAIEKWLHPKSDTKQKRWHDRNRDKMRTWRREYMRQYRKNGSTATKPEPSNTTDKLCTRWPKERIICQADGYCNRCSLGTDSYKCGWCKTFSTRSVKHYIEHIEQGCRVLHRKSLKRNKHGGLVAPMPRGG